MASTIPNLWFRLLLLSFILNASCSSRLVRRQPQTTPPDGAFVVRQQDTAEIEFSMISDAIAAMGNDTIARTIFIYPGTYNEQVYITYDGPLTIQGYTTDSLDFSNNEVTITNSMPASTAGSNDKSATLRVHKDNFSLYNVNVANTFGNEKNHSQAVALAAYGSQQGYYGCQISGYQDTLLAQTGLQVYAGSLIIGAVDFIFGQRAIAWFDNSVIHATGPGCVTANGRQTAGNSSWYIFNQCTISGASPNLTYLGRPWREFSRVTFQKSQISDTVIPIGWSTWNIGDERTSNVQYLEYNNSGVGSDTSKRASFSQLATSALELSDFTDSTSWIDNAYLSKS